MITLASSSRTTLGTGQAPEDQCIEPNWVKAFCCLQWLALGLAAVCSASTAHLLPSSCTADAALTSQQLALWGCSKQLR